MDAKASSPPDSIIDPLKRHLRTSAQHQLLHVCSTSTTFSLRNPWKNFENGLFFFHKKNSSDVLSSLHHPEGT